jgi:hypothetical protein
MCFSVSCSLAFLCFWSVVVSTLDLIYMVRGRSFVKCGNPTKLVLSYFSIYVFRLIVNSVLTSSEDGEDTFVRNFVNHLQDYTTSQTRIPQSTSLQWASQMELFSQSRPTFWCLIGLCFKAQSRNDYRLH